MDDLKKQLTQLREDFMMGTLDEKDVHKAPSKQFEDWLNHAMIAEVPEWQAMTLSTVSEKNSPSSRIVYLRQFQNDEYWFYGNYDSRKAVELKRNPNAALNFFWPQLQRQIRIEGHVRLCHDKTSDEYFKSRPTESKIGAWASPQSSPLSSREELNHRVQVFSKEFAGKEIDRPPYWGGWILKANYYEFWQGRKSRLHDRICYEPANNHWHIARIAP